MRVPCRQIDEERAEAYRRAGLWGTARVDETVLATARTRPGDLAPTAADRSLTHGELAAAVQVLASRLYARGLRRNDPVIVQLPNGTQAVVLMLALSSIGAPPVMAPTGLREYEIGHLIQVTQPVALAVPGKSPDFDHFAMARRFQNTHSCLRTLLVSGAEGEHVIDLDDLCAPPAPGEFLPDAEPARLQDPALCLVSSGTTGPPKAIARLHEAYAYQLRITPPLAGVGPDSVYLAAQSAAHGLTLGSPGILGTLSAGGRVVMSPSPHPETVFPLIEQEQVTHCALAPAHAEQWVKAARDTSCDLSSLSVLQIGGARPRRGQIEPVPDVLGCRVQQAYGMSEGLVSFTGLDDPEDVVLGTQGRPASPADEILILDEHGAPTGPGRVGELLTRGPCTIAGYCGDDAATAENFTDDGFYRTGDLVRLHEPSGSLVVEGRCREVINYDGGKVPAGELEAFAVEHSAVNDAAAIGIPHPSFGETVCLCMACDESAPPPTLSEIRAFLSECGLADFKLPERIEIVGALPYLGIGKVDKKRLRARFA